MRTFATKRNFLPGIRANEKKIDGKGIVRPLTPVLLLCLTIPSVGAGFIAGYYAREAQMARTTETYTWLKILAVYDPWTFKCQWMDGGEPFVLKFNHDGSDAKLGWDEGMIVEYVKFAKTPTGLSVADDSLGMKVFRRGAKFVDWRTDELLGSN